MRTYGEVLPPLVHRIVEQLRVRGVHLLQLCYMCVQVLRACIRARWSVRKVMVLGMTVYPTGMFLSCRTVVSVRPSVRPSIRSLLVRSFVRSFVRWSVFARACGWSTW